MNRNCSFISTRFVGIETIYYHTFHPLGKQIISQRGYSRKWSKHSPLEMVVQKDKKMDTGQAFLDLTWIIDAVSSWTVLKLLKINGQEIVQPVKLFLNLTIHWTRGVKWQWFVYLWASIYLSVFLLLFTFSLCSPFPRNRTDWLWMEIIGR